MIKFGPSGNDKLFYEQGNKSTSQAGKWINEIGLNAYEYSFGQGVRLTDATAKELGENFAKYGVSVSVHAPYYINFANESEEMVEKSYNYVIDSAKKCKLMGGNRVVVHTGTNGKLTRERALELCRERLVVLRDKLIAENLQDCIICLETMGKYTQIGNYEEIVDLCTLGEMYIPTFDFGHINCTMQGGLQKASGYEKIFNYAIDKLGINKIQNVHIHFSKIEYGVKGEIRHLTFEDQKYGPNFEDLAQAIKNLSLEPTIICESKEIMAQDALKMKKIYEDLLLK